MLLEIITPENKLFEGEVTSVKFPGTDGEFVVLNNHAPIISTLTKGLCFSKVSTAPSKTSFSCPSASIFI